MSKTIYKIEGRKCLCPIAGFSFFKPTYQKIFFDLPEGSELSLVREPENPFDSNAIAVTMRINNLAQKIGYVPAIIAKRLAQYMDAGKQFSCKKNIPSSHYTEIVIERIEK